MTSAYLQELKKLNYPEALNSINSDIKKSGVTVNLIKAKVFCLINMNKFTLALSSIKMSKKQGILRELFCFEAAYCLYRLGRYEASLRMLDTEKISKNLGYQLLKTQCLYRLEKFQESAEAYDQILRTENVPSHELLVNLVATKAQSHQSISESYELLNFDLCYNVALSCLNSRQFDLVEKYSNECSKFADQDDVSSSDMVNSEIVSICASLASDKNNSPEAEFMLRKLNTRSDLNEAQKLIINANLLLCSKQIDSDVNSSQIEGSKLFQEQKKQILANLFHSGSGKSKTILKKISSLKTNESDYSMETDSETFVSLSSLKEEAVKSCEKRIKLAILVKSKPFINEKWTPLRDRSTYLSKDKYLKTLKSKKNSKN